MLTLGSGVGCGFVEEGRILHGGFDMGAETGHMIVEKEGRKCGCGQKGCLETVYIYKYIYLLLFILFYYIFINNSIHLQTL